MTIVYKKAILATVSKSIVDTVGDNPISSTLIFTVGALPIVGPGMIIGYNYAGSNNKLMGTLLGGVGQIAFFAAVASLAPLEISATILAPYNALYFDSSYTVKD